jgi:hypothetical protein
MVTHGSTFREHPLVIGNKYIAQVDNPDFTQGKICSGCVYELTDINHSHYDGASIFLFKCLPTGELTSWWWFDQAADNLCLATFKSAT